MITRLFNQLNAEFEFNLDAAADIDNARCKLWITEKDDAFLKSWKVWKETRVWLYPPNGKNYKKWAKKALNESKTGCIVVGLFPATTESDWFKDFIFAKAEVRFINKRLNEEGRGSMIVIWGLTPCFKILEIQ
jgi:phage N-6-adenine-methyltransferase